ncbi:MAG: hypothetical protein RR425_05705, partial [Erysipelotrichales bacterium]
MKKHLKSILAMFLFFMIATINVQAWDGSTTTEPENKDNVYQIKSAEEFAWFAKEINSGKNYDAKLVNDIDLSNKEWTPIGPFLGTFDGNNKKIFNMNVTTIQNQRGLFSKNEG